MILLTSISDDVFALINTAVDVTNMIKCYFPF